MATTVIEEGYYTYSKKSIAPVLIEGINEVDLTAFQIKGKGLKFSQYDSRFGGWLKPININGYSNEVTFNPSNLKPLQGFDPLSFPTFSNCFSYSGSSLFTNQSFKNSKNGECLAFRYSEGDSNTVEVTIEHVQESRHNLYSSIIINNCFTHATGITKNKSTILLNREKRCSEVTKSSRKDIFPYDCLPTRLLIFLQGAGGGGGGGDFGFGGQGGAGGGCGGYWFGVVRLEKGDKITIKLGKGGKGGDNSGGSMDGKTGADTKLFHSKYGSSTPIITVTGGTGGASGEDAPKSGGKRGSVKYQNESANANANGKDAVFWTILTSDNDSESCGQGGGYGKAGKDYDAVTLYPFAPEARKEIMNGNKYVIPTIKLLKHSGGTSAGGTRGGAGGASILANGGKGGRGQGEGHTGGYGALGSGGGGGGDSGQWAVIPGSGGAGGDGAVIIW